MFEVGQKQVVLWGEVLYEAMGPAISKIIQKQWIC